MEYGGLPPLWALELAPALVTTHVQLTWPTSVARKETLCEVIIEIYRCGGKPPLNKARASFRSP